MKARFTIKQLLGMMVLFSILAICLASAYRGNIVAYGMLWGGVFLSVPFLFLAGFYWIAWAMFWAIERRSIRVPERVNPAFSTESITNSGKDQTRDGSSSS